MEKTHNHGLSTLLCSHLYQDISTVVKNPKSWTLQWKRMCVVRLALLLLIVSTPVSAQEYSPALDTSGATRLYWGDLHVHSNFSPDSFAFGNSRLTPDNALRFAKGERVTASNDMDVQLRRPLD